MADYAVKTVFSAQDKMSAAMDKMGGHADKLGNAHASAARHASEAWERAKTVMEGTLMAKAVEKGLELVGEAARELPRQLIEFTEKGEAIARVARVTGMSAEAFQRLSFAANLTDTSADTLQAGLKKLNFGLEGLHHNQGPLAEGLKKVNPLLERQLRTASSSQDAFLMVADAVQKSGSAQQRAAIAMAAFGKGGQDLIPMLLEGKDGLAKMMNQADEFGAVLDGTSIAAAERFQDSLKKTKSILTGFKNQALGGLAQAAAPYMEKLQEWIGKNRELISTRIHDWTEKLVQGTIRFGHWIHAAAVHLHKFYEVVKPALPVVLKLGLGLFAFQRAKGAFDLLKTGFSFFKTLPGLLGPSMPLVLGLGAAFALIATHWDQFAPFFKQLGTAGAQIFKSIGPILEKFKPLFEALTPIFDKLATTLADVLPKAIDALMPIVKVALDLVVKAANFVADTLHTLMKSEHEKLMDGLLTFKLSDFVVFKKGFLGADAGKRDSKEMMIDFQNRLNVGLDLLMSQAKAKGEHYTNEEILASLKPILDRSNEYYKTTYHQDSPLTDTMVRAWIALKADPTVITIVDQTTGGVDASSKTGKAPAAPATTGAH